MKKLGFILLAVMLFSCKGKTTYQARISIKNNLDQNINIRLYPKQAYVSGDLYSVSDNGSDKRNVSLKLSEGTEQDIYTTQNIDIQPEVLVSDIFDSIHISPADTPWRIIKFSADSLFGYRFNMFQNNSNWTTETRFLEKQTTLKRSPVESYDHVFGIRDADFEN